MFVNIQKVSECSIGTFLNIPEHSKVPKWINVWEQLTMFWIVARNVRKKRFLNNLFGNISECTIRTFQNVPEQVWKHFKVSSEKNVWEQLTMFWIIARNIRKKSFEHFKMFSEEFVWKHFWLFHWNISKCSLTFKKFPNKFVNISKCPSEKKCLRTTHNVLDNCQKCSSGKSFEYFKIFLNNLFGNILDCSLITF